MRRFLTLMSLILALSSGCRALPPNQPITTNGVSLINKKTHYELTCPDRETYTINTTLGDLYYTYRDDLREDVKKALKKPDAIYKALGIVDSNQDTYIEFGEGFSTATSKEKMSKIEKIIKDANKK